MSTKRFSRGAAFHSLGCKVSRAEAAALSPLLPPGAILVHTCTVTARADRDSRRLIRRVARENPGAPLVVAGCLAQRDPEGVADLPGVALVLGHGRRSEAKGLLASADPGPARAAVAWSPAGDGSSPSFALAGGAVRPAADPDRTRAFLKVQDGCSRRCSFCIVPSLRGPERSSEPGLVEREIHRLGEEGIAEVVLTGVHLASFGTPAASAASGGRGLLDLLEALERRPPACRVRLSCLEPMEAGEDLLDAVAGSSVVAPHLHLPLQSGSDAVLVRMRRGIRAESFARLVERVVRANPALHVATDLIAGYPAETAAEASETERLVRELPLASLHVFPFSPRSGTPAAEAHAASPVSPATAGRRAARLRELGEEKLRAFTDRALERPADLVVLRGGTGLTADYLEPVLLPPTPVESLPAPGSRFRARLFRGPGGRLLASPAPC